MSGSIRTIPPRLVPSSLTASVCSGGEIDVRTSRPGSRRGGGEQAGAGVERAARAAAELRLEDRFEPVQADRGARREARRDGLLEQRAARLTDRPDHVRAPRPGRASGLPSRASRLSRAGAPCRRGAAARRPAARGSAAGAVQRDRGRGGGAGDRQHEALARACRRSAFRPSPARRRARPQAPRRRRRPRFAAVARSASPRSIATKVDNGSAACACASRSSVERPPVALGPGVREVRGEPLRRGQPAAPELGDRQCDGGRHDRDPGGQRPGPPPRVGLRVRASCRCRARCPPRQRSDDRFATCRAAASAARPGHAWRPGPLRSPGANDHARLADRRGDGDVRDFRLLPGVHRRRAVAGRVHRRCDRRHAGRRRAARGRRRLALRAAASG